MRRNYIVSFLLFFTVSISYGQKVAGFFPDWVPASKVNDVQYDKLTDVYFAFLKASSTGVLSTTTANSENTILAPLAAKCQQNGVKIHVSVGGANHSGTFASVVSTAGNRTTFVNSAAALIQKHKLDGINLDWEFPAGQYALNFALLAQELRTKLDQLEISMGKDLELSAAVAPLVWNSDGINSDFIDACDFILLMAFDSGGNCCVCDNTNHSSYLIAERAMKKWTTGLPSTCGGSTAGKNTPASKIVLTIPFYTKKGGFAGYNTKSNYQAIYNSVDGNVGGFDFNSKPLIDKKVKLIMDQYQGAGVWCWELTQDRTDQYSLLGAMWDAMQPYMCDAPQPELGENTSICGKSSVLLESNVPSDGNLVFTWFKGSQQLVSSTSASSYSATSVGDYKVTVSNGNCENEDMVSVIGTLSPVSLGDDIHLCDFLTDTLSISSNEGSIKWYKDNVVISGESSTMLIVAEAGTYKVKVSATSCTDVEDNVNVTSGIVTADDRTYCPEQGDVTLKVIENVTEDVNWYDSEASTTPLFTGNEYTVSPTSQTTYYLSTGSVGGISCDGHSEWVTSPGYSGTGNENEVFVTYNDNLYTIKSGIWWVPSNFKPNENPGHWVLKGPCGGASCVKSSVNINIGDVCETTEEELLVRGISIHPNPTTDLIKVETASELDRIEVVTLTGQVKLTSISNNVDLSIFEQGTYIIKAYTKDGQILMSKIVKQ